jgi:hypothetical protein
MTIYYSFFWVSLLLILSIIIKSFRPLNLHSIGPKGKKFYLGSFSSYIILFLIYGYSYNYTILTTWKPNPRVFEIKSSKKKYLKTWRKVIGGTLFISTHTTHEIIKGKWICQTRETLIPLEKLKSYKWDGLISFELVKTGKIKLDKLEFNFKEFKFLCDPEYIRSSKESSRSIESLIKSIRKRKTNK